MAKITDENQEVVMNETQADVLKALLDADHKVEKQVFMKRFKSFFTIKALDGDVIDRIQEQCTYYVGKGNKRQKKTDEQKFSALIIQKACVVPDWGAKELLDAYGTHDPADVIKKRLLAGELAHLSADIMEISGFEDDEDEIENVKN